MYSVVLGLILTIAEFGILTPYFISMASTEAIRIKC